MNDRKLWLVAGGLGIAILIALIALIVINMTDDNEGDGPGIGIPALTVNTLTVNTSMEAPTITGTDMIVGDRLSVGGTSVYTGDATFSAALSAVDITDSGSTTLADAEISDLTVTTAMSFTQGAYDRSASFPFVSGSGNIVDSPMGWDIDAESEEAYSFGVIPQDCNQVSSIIIWAAAVSGGTKHALDIDIYGATDDEPYNTESYSANDVSSDTAVAASDITRWTVTDSGVAGATGFSAGDVFAVKVIGAPTGGSLIATDCRFMTIEVRYD